MDVRSILWLLAFLMAAAVCVATRKSLPPCLLKRVPRFPTRPKEEQPSRTDSPPSATGQERDCQIYKDLFFKLQNLEHNAHVLPQAKSLLLSFFSEALQSAHSRQSAILSLSRFAAADLNAFVKQEQDAMTRIWQEYLAGRKAGQPCILFQSTAEARHWLVQIAPVKLVDGAWLGHIHKVTTPFAHRRTTRAAWQVLSEELGDGDLLKNHVYLYAQLLQKVGVSIDPDSPDFIQHPEIAAVNNPQIWRSALGQLLISLFPHDFLPEILGFNLHFEMLALDTLIATKELREVGYDPYYFTLRVTIYNASSGHTAMASHIIVDYLGAIEAAQGKAAAQQMWKRIQVGFLLSESSVNPAPSANSPLVSQVLDVFEEKVQASNRLHDNCPISIGGRSLSSWLEPEAFSRDPKRQGDFLKCLSSAKPWVYPGNSSKSRLVRQLAWGGSMFGAFNDREVSLLQDWIDSLGPGPYFKFTGRTDLTESPSRGPDPLADYPVFKTPRIAMDHIDMSHKSAIIKPLHINASELDLSKLLPLWFAHPCLLESFIRVSWKTANPTGCAIIRLLRSQYGFLPEPIGVAGIDETRRVDYLDLIDIGLDMMPEMPSPPPKTLADILKTWPSPSAETMLATAMRPLEYGWILLGMAQAFVHLHSALASLAVLSHCSRAALAMAQREQESLSKCAEEIREGGQKQLDFHRGYAWGRQEIEKCFR